MARPKTDIIDRIAAKIEGMTPSKPRWWLHRSGMPPRRWEWTGSYKSGQSIIRNEEGQYERVDRILLAYWKPGGSWLHPGVQIRPRPACGDRR